MKEVCPKYHPLGLSKFHTHPSMDDRLEISATSGALEGVEMAWCIALIWLASQLAGDAHEVRLHDAASRSIREMPGSGERLELWKDRRAWTMSWSALCSLDRPGRHLFYRGDSSYDGRRGFEEHGANHAKRIPATWSTFADEVLGALDIHDASDDLPCSYRTRVRLGPVRLAACRSGVHVVVGKASLEGYICLGARRHGLKIRLRLDLRTAASDRPRNLDSETVAERRAYRLHERWIEGMLNIMKANLSEQIFGEFDCAEKPCADDETAMEWLAQYSTRFRKNLLSVSTARFYFNGACVP